MSLWLTLWTFFVLFPWTLADSSYYQAIEQLRDFNSKHSNYTQIRVLLEQAAANGNGDALCRLGELHLTGLPISSDNPTDERPSINFSKAYEYFVEAYQKQSADAPFFLAFLGQLSLHLQEFTPFSHLQTSIKQFMLEAAKRQSLLAKAWRVAHFYESTAAIPAFLNYTSHTSEAEKCEFLIEDALDVALDSVSAIQSNGAMETLPEPLHVDQYIEKSSEATLTLYSKMLDDTGGTDGIREIAQNYLIGNPDLGVEPNANEAFRLYNEAAAGNDPNALEAMGVMHLEGIGVPKNLTQAKTYFEKAIEAVHAKNGLGYMYLNGIGVELDYEKAFELISELQRQAILKAWQI